MVVLILVYITGQASVSWLPGLVGGMLGDRNITTVELIVGRQVG